MIPIPTHPTPVVPVKYVVTQLSLESQYCVLEEFISAHRGVPKVAFEPVLKPIIASPGFKQRPETPSPAHRTIFLKYIENTQPVYPDESAGGDRGNAWAGIIAK